MAHSSELAEKDRPSIATVHIKAPRGYLDNEEADFFLMNLCLCVADFFFKLLLPPITELIRRLTLPNVGPRIPLPNCVHRGKHKSPDLLQCSFSLLLAWLGARRKEGRKEMGVEGHVGGKDLNPG